MSMYKCAVCEGTFLKDDFTEEEQLEELKKNYPGFTIEDCELVCDDCYNLPYFKSLRRGRK